MKILWITNVIFPSLAKELSLPQTNIGGWTYSAATLLSKRDDIEIAVASPYNENELRSYYIDNIRYYLVPFSKGITNYSIDAEKACLEIKKTFAPDVVHIYGTEYPISLVYVNSCGNNNVVVSLQGLVSAYSKYYYAGIGITQILKNPILILQKWFFGRNNRKEIMTLKKINYYEGRSDWDKAVSWSINNKAHYYYCNRTLRNSFYENHWDINSIERFSIFVSQAQYPIKGLHQIILALPFILLLNPDTQVYIAGDSPFGEQGVKNKIKSLGYGRYLKKLIKRLKLESRLHFLGGLNESQICERYLKSHIFISPSSIENVPNSIAEAQIMGVPCVASYVGGNSTLIKQGETGFLYRFEEHVMLARIVVDLFNNDSLCEQLSASGREDALKRHDKDNNINTLIGIYNDIKQRNL